MKLTLKQNLPQFVLAFGLACSTVVTCASARADSDTTLSFDDNFHHGWNEVGAGSSVYFSNVVRKSDHPDINYAGGYFQAAYALTSPGAEGPLRGCFQIAPEVFGYGIYKGPGNYIAGATLWFRYNFVQPGWRFVPFIEGGGGGTCMDLPHSLDGKDFNFNLEAGVGARYFVTHHCSINLEYRFQHISNADLWKHNVGVNASGPTLGVSLFF